MKLLNFNIIAMLVLPMLVLATEHPDTTQHAKSSRRADWDKVFPDHAKVQTGGGIGLISAGPGWDYGKKRQWETDIMLGVVPWKESSKTSVSLAVKHSYIPWKIRFNNCKYIFEPLTVSLYMCQIWGNNMWVKEPSKYEPPYYGIPTGVRTHMAIGERVGMKLGEKSVMSFYYEISTNDLYLFSLLANKYLSLLDTLSLSFGLKFTFD